MSSELRPDNEKYLADAIAQGEFSNREAALNLAVDLLRSRAQMTREVNHGIEQIERGESTEIADDQELRRLFEDIKDRCRARLGSRRHAS